jgi:arylsulfatase A-like enzyme
MWHRSNHTSYNYNSLTLGKASIPSLFAALALACLVVGCNPRSPTPPNIILILADDAGYADFGFMGSDIPTPNLDRLALSGVVFTDAHITATVCSPSRAGLMTGRYQQRFGHEANIPPPDLGMDPSEKTLGDALKLSGYATAIIGKWHLGSKDAYHPNNRGFDEFWGFLGGSRSYFFKENNDDREDQEREILYNRSHVNFEGYLTDEFSEQSVKFIESNQDHPFFLFLSYNAVHTPMHALEADLEKFKDHPRTKLAAMTWSMDKGVGRVLDKVEELDLTRNTLIFFLSDNGGASNNQSSNLPLKGFKGNKYEGGQRTPFILSWPGEVPSGITYDGLTSSLDIFATSFAAAGLEKSPGKTLDGVNLIPFVRGMESSEPHQILFWRKEKMAAVRDGDYKLIRLAEYGYRLYNLAEDPGELRDLAESEPEILKQLITSLEAWEEELATPLWAESEPWQRVTFEIHKALMENREVTIKSPADLEKIKN